MKTPNQICRNLYQTVIALGLLLGMSTSVSAAESSTPTREDAVMVSITASIEAIDHETREATLKGPLGNTITFTVDKRVKRLKEFQVGDEVSADYFMSIAYELREPTAEEKEEPLVILEETAKAPKGTSPAAGGLRQIRAVCSIEGLDRPTETVTLKGPLGRYIKVRTVDPDNLPKMRIGQSVVVTYNEALAVSLEKIETSKD